MTLLTQYSTAELWCDSLAARNMIALHAMDNEHATSLLMLLSLENDEIISRYAVGADITYDDDGRAVRIAFIDGSMALCDRKGRWSTL